MNSKSFSSYFLPLLIAGALILVVQILMPFLSILALAGAFASMLWSVYQRLRHVTEGHDDLAAILVVLLVFLGVLAPLAIIVTLIGTEAAKLYASITDGTFVAHATALLQEAQRMLPRDFVGHDFSNTVAANLSTYLRDGLLWVSQHVTDTFSSIATTFLDLFIFFVALFFFLRDGESIKKSIIELSPLHDKDDEMVFERLAQAVNSVIRGNLLIALIRGVFSAFGFLFVGLPNPVLWGIVAGLVGLIPSFGITIVFAPAILYIYFASGWLPAAGLLLWGTFVVGLIDNALAPQLVGRGMEVHPLLVLLAIFGGITFFGPSGIFLGPLAVSFLFALLSIYSAPASAKKASTTESVQ